MEKEGTEDVKGSERERCKEDGGVKSSRGRSYKETKRDGETGGKEREAERRGDITRGERKSTERFQRHVGAL